MIEVIGSQLMECPFCAETIKDEAIACKHCSRDLRVVRPVIREIHEIVTELDKMQRELDSIKSQLALFDFAGPIRVVVRCRLCAAADGPAGDQSLRLRVHF